LRRKHANAKERERMIYDCLPFTEPGKRVDINVFYARAEKRERRGRVKANAEAVTQRRFY